MAELEISAAAVNTTSTHGNVEGGKGAANTLTVINDFGSISGATEADKLASILSKYPVFAFSKTTCPFCIEVKSTFRDLGVPIAVIETDGSVEGKKLGAYSKAQTKQSTFPSVYIKGRHVGGCDSVKELQAMGELDKMVRDLIVRQEVSGAASFETICPVLPERGEALHPLGWFPNVVNNNVVRLTGVLVVTTCAIAIGFHKESWCKWLVVGLCLDFVTRMLVGSSLSILGMIATLLTSSMTPLYAFGPQEISTCIKP